jgi:hypothetical protein
MALDFETYVAEDATKDLFASLHRFHRRMAFVRMGLTCVCLLFFWLAGSPSVGIAIFDAVLVMLWGSWSASDWHYVALCRAVLRGRGIPVRGGRGVFVVLRPKKSSGVWRAVRCSKPSWWDVPDALFPLQGQGSTGEAALEDALRRMGQEGVS